LAREIVYAILFALMTAPSPPTAISPDSKKPVRPGIDERDKSRSRVPRRSDDGRLVRGRKSRARIREAAMELFRERGFDRATLRAIAARAGMGASSIYRHVQSKEELLIDELSELQERAWSDFRKNDRRERPTRERIWAFLDAQHELLTRDRDLSLIALRATTRPEIRVSRQVLALYDRTIGLLAEILQMGRKNNDLDSRVNVLEAAQAIFHIALGARIAWTNGLVSADGCRRSTEAGVNILFRGLDGSAPTSDDRSSQS
jgi:AcrR family transcriptional regulator